MRRIVEEKVTPPTAISRDFPAALELIVMKALEKRPEDRYQSAEELRHDLEEFLDESGLRTGNRRVGRLHERPVPAEASRRPRAGVPGRQIAGPAREDEPEEWTSIAGPLGDADRGRGEEPSRAPRLPSAARRPRPPLTANRSAPAAAVVPAASRNG